MTNLALVQEGSVSLYPVSLQALQQRFPNTSFSLPLTAESLSELGVVEVVPSHPPQVGPLEGTVVESYPVFENGVWQQSWSVEPFDEIQKQDIELEQTELVRSHRNSLLSASDWTQLADAPVDSASWATYRQLLRDVTTQQGFPWEVVWPEVPA